MKNIFVELFRFDKDTDYLPYFKKYNLKVDENISINELLELINEKEEFAFSLDCNLKINNIFLNAKELLKDVIKKLGSDLKIEPISTYRAIKDLTINNDDFIKKLNIFSKYLKQEDLDEALSLYELDYYASNTLNFNKDYIGEHNLYLASKIINSNAKLNDTIISRLKDKEDGIYFHTSIKNRVFSFDENKEKQINELLNKTLKTNDIKIEDSGIFNGKSKTFLDFNIATYEAGLDLNLDSLVLNSSAKLINLENKNTALALHAFDVDKKFFFKIAGEILLEAKDSGADFLLIGDDYSFSIFDKEQKTIEKIVNREINLPIITKKEFISLLKGQRDKTISKKHKVSISFL